MTVVDTCEVAESIPSPVLEFVEEWLIENWQHWEDRTRDAFEWRFLCQVVDEVPYGTVSYGVDGTEYDIDWIAYDEYVQQHGPGGGSYNVPLPDDIAPMWWEATS